MFGYVTINRPELKVRELERYEAFYCGLCRKMKKRHGLLSEAMLNFDMTFLTILLSNLNDETFTVEKNRCFLHPLRSGKRILTKSGEYAADLNFMLGYHKLEDDWIDEKKWYAGPAVLFFRRRYRRLAEQYPRQHKALTDYVSKLHACEKRGEENLDEAAGLTGTCMSVLYVREEDGIWKEQLEQLGFYMGKFIYMMDAYDDVRKDQKNKNYNPFAGLDRSGELEDKIEDFLKIQLAGISEAFERLPIIDDAGLLRNIIYSGVWVRYAKTAEERRKMKQQNLTEGKDY